MSTIFLRGIVFEFKLKIELWFQSVGVVSMVQIFSIAFVEST